MKYLIVGLGNIGAEYEHTRHNIGFDVLDAMAREKEITFKDQRYGAVTEYKFKGRIFILLKPNTYVNLSGRAVNYWLQKEKIPLENLLVIVDDLALPFGTLRLKPKGGDAGHNGLKNIQAMMNTASYARLRFGIGNDFSKGQQVDYVLGLWSEDEMETLKDRIKTSIGIIKSFATIGVARTMNQFNKK
ncbi:MAG: aminoacyl-tRNA hydrolase [Marinilabiliaceae bacterium]|nr:aminoacyl-tRNA hydrolase [Marinilabiliaceae bacterium]